MTKKVYVKPLIKSIVFLYLPCCTAAIIKNVISEKNRFICILQRENRRFLVLISTSPEAYTKFERESFKKIKRRLLTAVFLVYINGLVRSVSFTLESHVGS